MVKKKKEKLNLIVSLFVVIAVLIVLTVINRDSAKIEQIEERPKENLDVAIDVSTPTIETSGTKMQEEVPSNPAPDLSAFGVMPGATGISPEMQLQLDAPPPELPEDLRQQLLSPPSELPEDLRRQLLAPPPELPEDIKRALETPPRVVSPDEVNFPGRPSL